MLSSAIPHVAAQGEVLATGHAFQTVNDWARSTSWLHGFMSWYATYGPFVSAVLVLAGWWIARRACDPRKMAAVLWTPLAAVIALGIAQPINSAVAERRPFVVIRNSLTLVHHSADYGFPSDHATFAGAVAVALLFVSWRLGLLATLAALLMAFARVYVGVHWPRDVVAGLLLGGVVALIGALLTASILARLVTWAGGTRLRPLVLARPAERASSGASVAGTEQAAEPAPPARPSDAPHSTLAVGHSSLSNSVEEGRVPGQV